MTPGPLAPARELLGEMLLLLGQPARGAEGVRGDAEEGAEPLPRGVRRGTRGVAGRRSGRRAPLLRAAAEDLRAGGYARSPRAGRGSTRRVPGSFEASQLTIDQRGTEESLGIFSAMSDSTFAIAWWSVMSGWSGVTDT